MAATAGETARCSARMREGERGNAWGRVQVGVRDVLFSNRVESLVLIVGFDGELLGFELVDNPSISPPV